MFLRIVLSCAVILALGACAEVELASHAAKQMQGPEIEERPTGIYKVGKPYEIDGTWYYPKVDFDYSETGIASWYGPGFHGKLTANGEIYDEMALTAAHRTLPMPSQVRVTNLENGRSIVVRINDRGPFKSGRIIDLSRRGADLLGFETQGTAKVRVEIMEEESRRLATIYQSRQDADLAPDPAPVVPVQSANLEGGTAVVETAGGTAVETAGGTAVETAGGTAVETAAATEPTVSAPPPGGGHILLPSPESGSPSPGSAVSTSQAASFPNQAEVVPSDSGAVQTAAAINTLEGSVPEAAPGSAGEALSPTWRVEPVAAPDGTVYQRQVENSEIYVQAGSFVQKYNADRLSRRLSVLGPSEVTPAIVGQQWFYRVRLGPVETVDEADRLLHVLVSNGINGARVVVD